MSIHIYYNIFMCIMICIILSCNAMFSECYVYRVVLCLMNGL